MIQEKAPSGEQPWPAEEQRAEKQVASTANTLDTTETPEWMATLTEEQRQYFHAAQRIALEEHERANLLEQELRKAENNEETTKLRELLNQVSRLCGLNLDALQRGERPKMISYDTHQKLLARFSLLRKSQWKPAERLTIDEMDFQFRHPQKIDSDGFTRINYESGARHTGLSDTTIKRNIKSILEQCSAFPIECKWDVPETTLDGREIKALYAKPLVPDLIAVAPTLPLDAKRKQGGDKYYHQCQQCLGYNIKTRKKVTTTIICLDCHHETILDEKVTEEIQKAQKGQKQLAFGKIYHAGYRQQGTLELIDQALTQRPELIVIDIRHAPNSKNSEWTKQAFFTRWQDRYTWVPDLGNTNYKNPGHIQIANPEKGMATLKKLLTEHSVILLCGCPEYDNCHRKSVIELYIQKQLAFDPHFCPHVDNLQTIIRKPVTPPASADAREASLADNQCLQDAAGLLLEVAGDAEVHIVMPSMHPSKYLDVHRRLELEDVLDHLRGGEARGALCRRADGRARGFCWDTDDEDGWELLRVSADSLVAAGFQVLLEESPAGRGGHLWMFFEELVQARLVQAEVLRIVPDLAEVVEYWPSLARDNRVRLPGGHYARYGSKVDQEVRAWCKLVSVSDGASSQDGVGAAALMLAHQNPAGLIPARVAEIVVSAPVPELQKSVPVVTCREFSVEELFRERPLPLVDAAWIEKCGPVAQSTFWFAVTEEYSAAWFNQHHTLEEVQSLERNGFALSPNGSERTASTAHWEKGGEERYTDFSLHGQRADGRHDSGDVLEYASKVWKRAKAVLLAEAARDVVKVARQNLEASAGAGKLPPLWVAELMTPAGWRKYDQLLAQAIQASEKEAQQEERGDATAGYAIDVSGDYVF